MRQTGNRLRPNPTTGPLDLTIVARTIFEQALAECSIDRAIDRTVRWTADAQKTGLTIDNGAAVSLPDVQRVRIVAAGKAAAAMLGSLLDKLPQVLSRDLCGILIAPSPPAFLSPSFQFFAGGHPLPNRASLAGASAVLTMLEDVRTASPSETLCIFLISGGASSMMEAPLDTAITVDETAAFHRALVHSGATIVEMNCVRKHFSAVKGGRLSLAAGTASKLTLLVSDVPPAHLDALGSGPTIPDPTTLEQCRAVLDRYHLLKKFPTGVQRFFESPELPETPKPGSLYSPTLKLLDSNDLAEAAKSKAIQLGFHAVIDNQCDDWTYDAAADYLLDRFRQIRSAHRKACLISTGEVSVKLPEPISSRFPGEPNSTGGRNQHFALYVATRMRPQDSGIAVLSVGTDGIDGNSSAAGAVVTGSTLDEVPRTQANGKPSESTITRRTAASKALEEYDSSAWLSEAGATIVTGPTGHNLRDLRIFLST